MLNEKVKREELNEYRKCNQSCLWIKKTKEYGYGNLPKNEWRWSARDRWISGSNRRIFQKYGGMMKKKVDDIVCDVPFCMDMKAVNCDKYCYLHCLQFHANHEHIPLLEKDEKMKVVWSCIKRIGARGVVKWDLQKWNIRIGTIAYHAVIVQFVRWKRMWRNWLSIKMNIWINSTNWLKNWQKICIKLIN